MAADFSRVQAMFLLRTIRSVATRKARFHRETGLLSITRVEAIGHISARSSAPLETDRRSPGLDEGQCKQPGLPEALERTGVFARS
jgi:hypothetical protein